MTFSLGCVRRPHPPVCIWRTRFLFMKFSFQNRWQLVKGDKSTYSQNISNEQILWNTPLNTSAYLVEFGVELDRSFWAFVNCLSFLIGLKKKKKTMLHGRYLRFLRTQYQTIRFLCLSIIHSFIYSLCLMQLGINKSRFPALKELDIWWWISGKYSNSFYFCEDWVRNVCERNQPPFALMLSFCSLKCPQKHQFP